MRVGIDARVLGTSRALDVYTRNLIPEIIKISKNQIVLLFKDEQQKQLIDIGDAEVALIPDSHALSDHIKFKDQLTKLNLDVIWHPDNKEFVNCIPNSVVTIHDLTPIKYPDVIFSKSRLLQSRQRMYFYLMKKAWKKAKTIITVSQSSANDIVDLLGVSKARVKVVPNGVGEQFKKKFTQEQAEAILEKYKITKPYIFYIGGLNAHKNVETLIRAFSVISDEKVNLVIGGKTSNDNSSGQNTYFKIHKLAEELGVVKRVTFTGFIDDQDLPCLYKKAEVFVYPSLYEGFGLPPLEAMASGTPVVASNVSSIPEVVGDSGVLLDPTDPHQFALAIDNILVNPNLRQDLSAKGIDRAENFNWKEAAKRIESILNTAGNND